MTNEAPERIWIVTEPHHSGKGPPHVYASASPTKGIPFAPLALMAAEREACAEDVWHECYPSTSRENIGEIQLAEAATTELAIRAIRARTDADAQSALEARDKRVRAEMLGVVHEYLTSVYGVSPLAHPVDRKRIFDMIEKDQADE